MAADPGEIGVGVLDRVCRTGFDRPGFALLPLGADLTPAAFRALLIDLVSGVSDAYRARFGGGGLELYWMGRFSQQRTTEAHLDGAPDESVLVLGYEPSAVPSRIHLYDYARAAADAGIEPKAFLDRFNPTFGEGRAALEPYRTELTAFDPARFNVLVINNSSAPLASAGKGMLGVLHQSIVPDPRPAEHRYINTLMLRTAGSDSAAGCGPDVVRAYVDAAACAAC